MLTVLIHSKNLKIKEIKLKLDKINKNRWNRIKLDKITSLKPVLRFQQNKTYIAVF